MWTNDRFWRKLNVNILFLIYIIAIKFRHQTSKKLSKLGVVSVNLRFSGGSCKVATPLARKRYHYDPSNEVSINAKG
ncbi:hypothetical protein Aasi_0320 [Candidatus Amoebophilus asiaticus 5a2]|uniref:Uncharacterized protein n=1 Tax=Amoebophilus asiaticus (strain 5a2) TaxID=452471 RepID=B3ERA2_AMOA5|nr:hypothetical protein Aasi_0320 [Candidatus Amoebophilus asiaticus 5a2]